MQPFLPIAGSVSSACIGMSGHIPDAFAYGQVREQIQRGADPATAYAALWHVPPQMAAEWLEYLETWSYFATAVMAPTVWASATGEVPGMMIAVSTPETACIQRLNHDQHEQGRGIGDPFWKYMHVWKYERLAFLNFAGITGSPYGGHLLPAKFGQVLEDICIARNVLFSSRAGIRGSRFEAHA